MIRFMYGVLFGLVLGGIAGVLLAPASGQELRNQIRSEAEATRRRAEAEWQKQRQTMNAMLETRSKEPTGSVEQTEVVETAG